MNILLHLIAVVYQNIDRCDSSWPIAQIKRRIRRVLGDRILAFISNLVQNLKRQILFQAVLPYHLILTTIVGNQSDFSQFQSEDNFVTDSAQEPKVEDSTSEETPEDELDNLAQGIIYARVSSNKQCDKDNDKGSIEGQIEEMKDIAEKENIEIACDPITDKAQTGTNFDRDGIQEVFEKAKQPEISYLLVEKVDRIGRSAPETLYFIYILQSECDVTLLTSGGEKDVSNAEGLMHTTLMSLMAEIQNDLRTTKAKKERIRGFLQNKNWSCASPKIPLGYEGTQDGWLKVDHTEKEIVRDLFQKFVECETYSEVKEYIDEKYGSKHLEGHQVKTVLQNWVYIGKPKLPNHWLIETTYENDLDEPDLNILEQCDDSEIDINEEVFHQAQDIIKSKNAKGSTDEETNDLLDFLEEFSLFAVVEGTEPATLLHSCGEPMVKDGQVDLKGQKIHRYRCRNCEESEEAKEYYRQWPRESELDKIRLIQKVLDDDTSLFDDSK